MDPDGLETKWTINNKKIFFWDLKSEGPTIRRNAFFFKSIFFNGKYF